MLVSCVNQLIHPPPMAETVLLDAFNESNREVSRQVLEAGADANVEDEGRTLWPYTALLNHAKMAGRLIVLGAKPPK